MWHRGGEHSDDYKRHISNISWRFKFDVVEEEDGIYKVDGDVRTLLTEDWKDWPAKWWWHAWVKLSDEYKFSGIWTDERGSKIGYEE